MNLDQIIASVLSALDPEAFVATIAAGIGFAFILGVAELPLKARSMWFLMVTVGVLFFAARGFALIYAGSNLWPRNIGFTAIWVCYSTFAALTYALRRR